MNTLKLLLWVGAIFVPSILHAAGFLTPRCSVSTTPLNFGIYWGTSTLVSTAKIVVSCNLPATTRVQMDKGLHSLNFATRKMKFNQKTLNYNLYTNASRSNVWGDGTGGTWTVTGSQLIVHASIPGGQIVTPGTYNDTVVVTVIW